MEGDFIVERGEAVGWVCAVQRGMGVAVEAERQRVDGLRHERFELKARQRVRVSIGVRIGGRLGI